MSLEVNGKAIETDANGFLSDPAIWDKDIANEIAKEEGISLEQDHWDVIDYLRDEFFNNNGNQPNMRNLLKAMGAKWSDRKVDSKALYDLFPGNPSKQAGRIAGLPESRRKGGY